MAVLSVYECLRLLRLVCAWLYAASKAVALHLNEASVLSVHLLHAVCAPVCYTLSVHLYVTRCLCVRSKQSWG